VRFLILAHPGDETAARVAARLLRRHPFVDTRLVSLDEIILAPQWAHRLEGARVESVLTLHDGTMIHSDAIGVVFNRLRYVDMPHFAVASAVDREYAVMEMFALLLSWLAALRCPVISPVSPQGLGGPSYTSLAWQYLASKSGLPTARVRLTSSVRRYPMPGLIAYSMGPAAPGNVPAWLVDPPGEQRSCAFVVGDQVFGGIPAEFIEPCLKLASLSGIEILLIHFVWSVSRASWVFSGVDPCPAMANEGILDSVVRLLEVRS